MLRREPFEEAESTVRGKKITWGRSTQNVTTSFGNLSAEKYNFNYLNGKHKSVILVFAWIRLDSFKKNKNESRIKHRQMRNTKQIQTHHLFKADPCD